MSGKPSPDGVEKLRHYLKAMCELGTEISDLRAKTARLKAAEEAYGFNYHAIVDLLKDMDTESKHNAGWEGRLVWLLGELDRQAMEDAPKPLSISDAVAYANDAMRRLVDGDEPKAVAEHVGTYFERLEGDVLIAWMNALTSANPPGRAHLTRLNTALAETKWFHETMRRFHEWKLKQTP